MQNLEMWDIHGFWGFSLLRYVQKQFNSGFNQNNLLPRTEYTKMPDGVQMNGVGVKGLIIDYSMLPRVIEPVMSDRDSYSDRVAEVSKVETSEFSGVCKIDEESRRVAEESRMVAEETKSGWTKFLVGPDIFLSSVGGAGRGCGRGFTRKLVGIEYFDWTLVNFDGVLREREIFLLGEAIQKVDNKFKLDGRLVEILWGISQFTPNSKRNALVMTSSLVTADAFARKIELLSTKFIGSEDRTEFLRESENIVRAVSFGIDVLRGDFSGWNWHNVIVVPEIWCKYIFMEFNELCEQTLDFSGFY